ncbi:MAG TPA: hypothetical protein VHG72_17635 [Polyangia bacterium]|nr:hypothetical protein [Polyangia bacterium]
MSKRGAKGAGGPFDGRPSHGSRKTIEGRIEAIDNWFRVGFVTDKSIWRATRSRVFDREFALSKRRFA